MMSDHSIIDIYCTPFKGLFWNVKLKMKGEKMIDMTGFRIKFLK